MQTSRGKITKPKSILCGHPELYPTGWEQKKPEPAYMVGCIHNHSCPVCGFGYGIHLHDFNCKDRLATPPEQEVDTKGANNAEQ